MNYIEHYKKDAEEFDYFKERFGASEDDEKRLREYILSKVPEGSGTVLDTGCGSAWVAKDLLPMGKIVISTDLAYSNVNKAVSKYPHPNHFGVVCDSLNLPFKQNVFDTIIASEIIEHITDPEAFVKSLFAVVKPNGNLLVSTPYKEKLIYTLCVHCNGKTPLHAHLHSFDERILIQYGYSAKAVRADYSLFGNKYLIFGRTYIILKYLPFGLWRLVDSVFNRLLGKPVHILVIYIK